MPDFLKGTLIADIAMGFLALEIAAVLLWRRAANLPSRWFGLLASALPGLCLLLALRAALSGEPWPWATVWLACSLPAHLLDMRVRPP